MGNKVSHQSGPGLSSKAKNGIKRATRKANELNKRSATKFQYDILQPGWIRLLDLQPGSGTDPVICSLSAQPLETRLEPFEAVSYVWGNPAGGDQITCNWRIITTMNNEIVFAVSQQVTSNFQVTNNLYQLLLHLRYPEYPRRLWIDQICINQSDLRERGEQVLMMAQLYAEASNVLIWLGEEDEHTETAFGCMDFMGLTSDLSNQEFGEMIDELLSIDDFSDAETAALIHQVGAEITTADLEALKATLIQHVRPVIVEGIEASLLPGEQMQVLLGMRSLKQFLLDRTWFRRAWTFQETVMARKATVHCGKFTRDWDLVYAACQCLLSKIICLGNELNREEVIFAAKNVIKKGDLRRDWAKMYLLANPGIGDPADQQEARAWVNGSPDALNNVHAQMRLETLLPEIRPTGATDPRDKVLALLGISHDNGRRFPFPGYMSPVEDLYTAVVRYWLNSGEAAPDLSFLSHVQDANPGHKLPSWVPDWSCPLIATPILGLAQFRAAGDSVAVGEIVDAGAPPKLRVRGFLVLTVRAVDNNLRDFSRHAEMIGLFDNPYPTTSMSYPEAYRCAADPSRSEDFQPPGRAPGCHGFWDCLHRQAQNAPELAKSRREEGQGQHGAVNLRSKLPPIQIQGFVQASESTQMPGIGRAFFISAEGFMGLAPRHTRAGDQIYIFLGATVPFAVRKREDMTAKFLGECYVFGLMHGEAARDYPKERLEDILLV